MRKSIASTVAGMLGAFAATALAGTVAIEPGVIETTAMPGGFENARKPISNPTLFDLALPGTNVHPIVLYHNLPSYVNTLVGPLAMGGHVEVYALQFEIAFTDRLSLVATKDGYVRFKPDQPSLWSKESGFANIAAGLKYAFIYDPENSFAMSGTATYEFPTGNHDVYQGEGYGALNLILSTVKMWDKLQVAGAGGVRLPFDGQQATNSFVSAHASYEVMPWFIPLVEVNWHHVLSAGNGRNNYFSQALGLTPVVATFEGNDLLNFGASNATRNRDLVTAAVGFRSRITDSIDVGFAYELPLTDKHDSVMDDRYTLDLVWKF
ncbi:transporter [Haloferula sargassicola]|uniref:Transporter n=1 Tax=Haloferula sargassicola TaxID=490096 RepID=A0ABP9UQT6_9BACT